MASYTRLIEFKVKDTELNRAVNKLSKTLDRIDKTLVGIDKKLDHIATKGFGGIAKEAIKAEKSVGKLGKAVKALSSPQGLARGAVSGAFGLLAGKKGEIARRVTELYAFDGVLRKLTNGNTGLPAFNKRVTEAATALAGFGLAHTGAIAAVVGGSAAILTGTKFFYDLGKGVRQAEANMIDFIKTSRQLGLGAGFKSLFPKGSIFGGDSRDTSPSFDGKKAAEAVNKELGRTFTGQRSPVTGFGSLGSLDTQRKALAHTKQIQEKLVALTGKHLQASIQVRKAMIGYNLELAKTKVVQGFVTADLWAMQKAWQGIVSTIKGAGNLVGGLFGGKFGGVGQAAGVIGLSRGIEALTGKLGFLNKAWIENINKVALWSTRAAEAIASVNIAYGVLSTGLNAASWTVGAIKGFVDFEKQAVLSLNKINAARINLDKKMSSWLSRNKPGFGKKGGSIGPTQNKAGFLETMFGPIGLMMGDRMSGELQEIYGGASKFKDRSPLAERLEKNLAKAKEELSKLHTTSKGFEAQLRKVVALEERMNKEIAKRKQLYKQISPTEIAKTEAKEREESIKRGNKLRADADKKIKAAAAERYKEIQRRWQLEESNHRREVQRIKQRNQLAKQRRAARAAAIGRFGENVMLGAGFPMLFGGGPGAVAGGLTGAVTQSLAGSKGFGMQILFSAVGQQVDALVGKISTLGQAFNDMNPDVDRIIGSLGETNTAYGKHLEMLKKIKGDSAAMTEATRRLTGLIGKEGVAGLKKFGDDTQALANAWSKFATLINTSLAQWINASGILVRLTNALSRASRFKSAKRAANEGNEELAKLFAQRKGLQSNFMRGVDKQGNRKRWGIEEYKDALGGIDDQIDAVELKRQGGLVPGDLFGKGADKIAALTQERDFIHEKIRLGDREAEIQKKIQDILRENPSLKEQEVAAAVRAVAIATEQYEAQQKLNELYLSIGQTIEDGIVDALDGAIQGTKTLGQVASSVFRSISRMLIQYGVQAMFPASGFAKFFGGGKADGGSVTGNKSYIVGEKGPELFTPKSSGHITPNDELGGGGTSNITVNVDASGSSVEGDADQSAALGKMLGAAIQAELIKQRRPGGLLR